MDIPVMNVIVVVLSITFVFKIIKFVITVIKNQLKIINIYVLFVIIDTSRSYSIYKIYKLMMIDFPLHFLNY